VRVVSGREYQFRGPDALVLSGDDLWVANNNSLFSGNNLADSLTEVDASTRALVRVVLGSPYRFDNPDAMALSGGHLFVANDTDSPDASSGSLTEVDASTGALVRVVSGPVYQFNGPFAMVVSGHDLFVANAFGGYHHGFGFGSLTEVDASTGALGRVISAPAYKIGFNGLVGGLVVSGQDLFVASSGGGYHGQGSLTELDAATGALVRVISGPTYRFDVPVALTLSGNDLFVANSPIDHAAGSLTEVDANTGAVVKVISGRAYKFAAPGAIALSGEDLFVANGTGGYHGHGSLTEVDATTGSLVRVISGPAYRFDLGQPAAMVANGRDLFVADGATDSLTEVDAATGALVRVVSGPAYPFNDPSAMALRGDDLFVANRAGRSLTEMPLPDQHSR
jgi:PQQ-like domain